MSWFGHISESYSVLWKMIIRPPRDRYHIEELGPVRFRIGDRQYERTDLQLENNRGMALECSHYRPRGSAEKRMPCVVYLHGNCSSRVEACDVVPLLLPCDISLFTLDFAGSGHSQGEYISLGHWEEMDLRVVIQHLRGPGMASAIALWGRSMGAATSVLRAAQDPGLAGCVMDSPFGSLQQVAEELVSSGSVPIPSFLLSMALGVVGSEVRDRADFELVDLCPAKEARFAVAPALFGVASDDNFVLPHHTMDIFGAWGGKDKKIITFSGGHNGQRPDSFRDEVVEFLTKRLAEAQTANFISDTLARAKQLRQAAGSQQRAAGDNDAWKTIVPPSLAVLPVPSAAGANVRPAGRNAEMIAELVSMGFDEGIAIEAMRRNSSAEGAVEWIMQQSIQALGNLGHVELRAPDRHATVRERKGTATAEAREAAMMSGAREAGTGAAGYGAGGQAAAATENARKRLDSGGDLVEQLTQLGISHGNATEASRRCSSVEAAMDWLVTNNKL